LIQLNQLPYLLPWVRVALLIRSIRATTFDEATWPTAKTVLARALVWVPTIGSGALGVDARAESGYATFV
jgi:hypothetical protein